MLILCPFVVQALKYSDKLTGAPFRLDCQTCPREKKCEEWVEGDSYKYSGKPLFKVEWDKCPTYYLKGPHLAIALKALSNAKVSDLSGWPYDFTNWFVEYVTALHHAIQERQQEDLSNGSW